MQPVIDMKKPLISYSTDFGAGNKGHGVMRATALEICPEADIIELFTDVPAFSIKQAARLFECVKWLPEGAHVCVVDPGVGTERRALIIETQRGDFLIGPDNGVLIPAAKFLGGIKRVFESTNEKFMRQPVSNVFHGRDIFIANAAHLAAGVKAEEFGKEMKVEELVKAPYEEAIYKDGKIECEIIDVNNFGNVFLNVLAETMHHLAKIGNKIKIQLPNKEIGMPYIKTFGEVGKSKAGIMDDDFGRVEIALNQDNFAEKFKLEIGNKIILSKK